MKPDLIHVFVIIALLPRLPPGPRIYSSFPIKGKKRQEHAWNEQQTWAAFVLIKTLMKHASGRTVFPHSEDAKECASIRWAVRLLVFYSVEERSLSQLQSEKDGESCQCKDFSFVTQNEGLTTYAGPSLIKGLTWHSIIKEQFVMQGICNATGMILAEVHNDWRLNCAKAGIMRSNTLWSIEHPIKIWLNHPGYQGTAEQRLDLHKCSKCSRDHTYSWGYHLHNSIHFNAPQQSYYTLTASCKPNHEDYIIMNYGQYSLWDSQQQYLTTVHSAKFIYSSIRLTRIGIMGPSYITQWNLYTLNSFRIWSRSWTGSDFCIHFHSSLFPIS